MNSVKPPKSDIAKTCSPNSHAWQRYPCECIVAHPQPAGGGHHHMRPLRQGLGLGLHVQASNDHCFLQEWGVFAHAEGRQVAGWDVTQHSNQKRECGTPQLSNAGALKSDAILLNALQLIYQRHPVSWHRMTQARQGGAAGTLTESDMPAPSALNWSASCMASSLCMQGNRP